MKFFKKTLALILSIIMIVSAIPVSTFAVETKSVKPIETAKQKTVDTEKLKVVGEVEEKRNEYKKVYELEDGTFCEVRSSSPLHVKRLGKWVDAKKVAQPKLVENITATADELTEAIATKKNVERLSLRNLEDDDLEEDTHDDCGVQFAPSTPSGDECISNSCAVILQDNEIPFGDETPLGYTNQLTLSYTVTLELSESENTSKVFMYPVDHDWTEDATLVFSNFDYRNQPNIDIADIQEVELEGFYDFDASFVYNDWLIGARNNYGLAFVSNSSDQIELIGDAYQVRIYKEMSLINLDSTYHSLDMGLAGTLYIDDYTNQVSLARDEMGMPNNTMPVAIERWISPISLGESSCYGENCYMNYHSYITVANQIYTWYSIGGTAVKFTVSNTSQDVADSDGLGYTINVAAKTITDSNGTIYLFNSALYLTSITDSYQNKIKISYSTSNGVRRISYIEEDANARRYSFSYDNISFTYNGQPFTKRLLTDITLKQGVSNRYSTVQIDGEDVNIHYEYIALSNERAVLRRATYPDGSSVTYNYDNSSGNLTAIVDADGRKATVNYSTAIARHNLGTSNTISEANLNRSGAVCVGYTEEKVNSNDTSTYLPASKLLIDNHTQLYRSFDDKSGNVVSSKFNSYLLPDVYIDEEGNNYTFDYESTPNKVKCIKAHTAINSIIENGEFLEDANHDFEDSWFTESNCDVVSLTYDGASAGKVLKFDANGSGTMSAYTVIDLSDTGYAIDENTNFVLDCDAYLNTANENSDHFAGIKVYPCEDDEGGDAGAELYSMSFESGNSFTKQHKCGVFSLGNDLPDYLKVEILYTSQYNDAYFDNVSLIVDNGSIVEERDLNEEPETLNAEDYYQLTIQGRASEHIISDGEDIIAERFTYSNVAPYNITSRTDYNNSIVFYTYNNTTGLLSSKQKGNKETNYSYNPLGLLKSVETVEANVGNNPISVVNAFDYDYNKIASVTHGSEVYSFDYDTNGNVSSVNYTDSSNNTNTYLMQSFYNNSNKQGTIQFAGGDHLTYQYNNDGDRIISISFTPDGGTETDLVEYQYDSTSEKNLVGMHDLQTHRIYSFGTDGSVSVTDENTSNGLPQIEQTVEGGGTQLVDSPYDENPLPSTEVYTFSRPTKNTTKEKMYDWQVETSKNENSIDSINNTKTLSSSYEFALREIPFSVTEGNSTYSYHGANMSGSVNVNTSTVKDAFGRTKSSEYSYQSSGSNVEHKLNNTYTYSSYSISPSNVLFNDHDSATTYMPSSYTTSGTPNSTAAVNMTYTYKYNEAGFVKRVIVKNNNLEQTYNQLPLNTPITLYFYDYDNLGQIVTQYDYGSSSVIYYEYDLSGNITKKTIKPINNSNVSFNSLDEMVYTFPSEYNYSEVSFTYNSQNQLTQTSTVSISHANGTDTPDSPVCKSFSYDKLGNTTHYEIDNKSYDLEWEGFQLKRFYSSEDSWTNYFYDDVGHLIEKVSIKSTMVSIGNDNHELRTLNERTIKYIWQDDVLSGMEYRTFNDDNEIVNITTVKYIYDDEGNLIGAMPHLKYKTEENLSQNPTPNTNNGYECILSNKPIWFINDGLGNIVGMYQDEELLSLIYNYNANGEVNLSEMYGSYFDGLSSYLLSHGTPSWALPIVMVLSVGLIARELTVHKPIGYRGYLFDAESGLVIADNRYYSPYLSRYIDGNPSYMTNSSMLQSTYITNRYAFASNNSANLNAQNQSIYDFTTVPYVDIKTTLWMREYFN